MSDRNDLVQRPRWRTRTTPERRRRLALVTFAVVLLPGLFLMVGAMWFLDWAGAPAWVTALAWLVPTLTVLVWALWRPSPAEPTDDDEQSWPGFAIRAVIVGETTPRAPALRAVAAVVFGGPVGWSVLLLGTAAILGFD